MRQRMAWLVSALVAGTAGFLVFSWSWGQDAAPPAPAGSSAPSSPGEAAPERKAAHDLSKLPLLQRQMYLGAQRGADWLYRANRSDGRFVHGYVPDLKTVLEGDHYLRQAGAAAALARAARFLRDERYATAARQAVLTLLLDTAPDPQDPHARSTTLPSAIVNRLAAAGLLVLAINELSSPGDDLLQQSEQLCAFIRKQQRPDGSLCYTDSPADGPAAADPEGVNYYPGEALYGLMRSQKHRPAAWKTEVVRKALDYYRPWWQAHKSLALAPRQAGAYTEAYLLTRDRALGDGVLEMADWMAALQYTQLDPRHPLWVGGFMGWADGKAVPSAPQVGSAVYAEGLADACRAARLAGDQARERRYREALERSLQFLLTLQYTEVNTQHFAEWYRPVLVGAFHASHQDGNLRIDYTQTAVCALVQYLEGVVEIP